MLAAVCNTAEGNGQLTVMTRLKDIACGGIQLHCRTGEGCGIEGFAGGTEDIGKGLLTTVGKVVLIRSCIAVITEDTATGSHHTDDIVLHGEAVLAVIEPTKAAGGAVLGSGECHPLLSGFFLTVAGAGNHGVGSLINRREIIGKIYRYLKLECFILFLPIEIHADFQLVRAGFQSEILLNGGLIVGGGNANDRTERTALDNLDFGIREARHEVVEIVSAVAPGIVVVFISHHRNAGSPLEGFTVMKLIVNACHIAGMTLKSDTQIFVLEGEGILIHADTALITALTAACGQIAKLPSHCRNLHMHKGVISAVADTGIGFNILEGQLLTVGGAHVGGLLIDTESSFNIPCMGIENDKRIASFGCCIGVDIPSNALTGKVCKIPRDRQ